MTIRVRITNESDPNSYNNRIIEVVGGDGSKNIVGPGKFVETHVWQGTQIVVTEIEVKGERRGNPNDGGYGALPPKLHD